MDKKREESFLKLVGLKGAIDILRYLNEHNTAQYKHLGELMNVNVLNKRLNQLLKFDLIMYRPDKKDLRRKWYELAGKGKKILQILEKIIRVEAEDKHVSSLKILQKYSEEIFDALLSILSPVTGGADCLEEMHKEYCIRKEIHSLQRKQHEFLAIINALSQETAEEYDKIGANLKKIQENPQFVKNFEKLNNLFNSLGLQDQVDIICETAEMTHKLFSAMQDEISKKGVGSSDPGYMMVLGQALRGGITMLDKLTVSMKKRPPDMGQAKRCTDFLLVLLTKLLAISRGKMNIGTLYKDIAFCIYHTEPQIKGPIDEAAFAILGEDE